jgi:hypothetical protein
LHGQLKHSLPGPPDAAGAPPAPPSSRAPVVYQPRSSSC